MIRSACGLNSAHCRIAKRNATHIPSVSCYSNYISLHQITSYHDLLLAAPVGKAVANLVRPRFVCILRRYGHARSRGRASARHGDTLLDTCTAESASPLTPRYVLDVQSMAERLRCLGGGRGYARSACPMLCTHFNVKVIKAVVAVATYSDITTPRH